MSTLGEFKIEKPSSLPLDPRTKIFLTITVSTIMISGNVNDMMNIIRPCLAFMPISFFIFDKRFSIAIKYFFGYIFLFLCEILLLPYLSGMVGYLVVSIIAIFSHMLPGGIMGYFLISSTTVSEFVAAMERMHISPKVIIPISVVFRFIPTVKEEYVAINNAMKIRGIASLRAPIQMLEYRIVPLFISVVKIGEELSASALTRGLGRPAKRTNICEIGFGLFDLLLTMVAIICWLCFLFF